MTWLVCIGLMVALVLASGIIANKYGTIALPSLVMLWLGAFAVAAVLPGYLVKWGFGQAEQVEVARPATK
jgi:uncharacterized membrane protein